jgi:hypothetical protein
MGSTDKMREDKSFVRTKFPQAVCLWLWNGYQVYENRKDDAPPVHPGALSTRNLAWSCAALYTANPDGDPMHEEAMNAFK